MAKYGSLGAAMTGEVKVSATKSKPKMGKLTRLEIEVADNGGFTVTCWHQEPKTDKNRYDGPYSGRPEKSVFEDKASLNVYLDKVLG